MHHVLSDSGHEVEIDSYANAWPRHECRRWVSSVWATLARHSNRLSRCRFEVWGVDISERTVNMVRAGQNPTGDPDVDDIVPLLALPVEHHHVHLRAVPHCDVVLVTVPTPVTHDLKPDLTFVEAAGRAVFEALPRGKNTVVVLESLSTPA